MPSIPSCWSRRSTNSSRTQGGSNSPFRRLASGLQPHRRGPHGGNPAGRPVLAAAFPAAGAVRRKRAHRGGAGMLGVDGDRSATDSDRRLRCRSGRNTSAAPRAIASPAQGRRRPASDRGSAGRGVCRRASARCSLRCTIDHAADSNCPPIRSSAVASGPRLPASRVDGAAGIRNPG